MRTRPLNMTWSNLKFNVWRSFVTMATNLSSCFLIQFLEQLLKFLVNFTLLKYVKSRRNYGFLITKELIFDFQILDLKAHFSASLISLLFHTIWLWNWVYRLWKTIWSYHINISFIAYQTQKLQLQRILVKLHKCQTTAIFSVIVYWIICTYSE